MARNGRKNGREAVVLALAGGETVAAAARKTGMGERTIHRWRQDAAFCREVEQARADMFSRALGCIAEGCASSALVLRQLALKAKSESVKLSAARALLELGPKLRESVELEQRLAALEERTADDRTAGRR
ncbi:MAG TPA: helix-turn-helix domain-containing protein [Gemmataceae bacterium]|nr:helix-turn-helix domain-containing protein [Gemmataceae bacterium]